MGSSPYRIIFLLGISYLVVGPPFRYRETVLLQGRDYKGSQHVAFSSCDTLNPGVPLTTRQPMKFLSISGDPIPYCCVPFIGIHIFTKNRAESPLFGELYPTYNLYNHNPFRVSTEVVMITKGLPIHSLNIQLYHNYSWTPSSSAPPQYIPLLGSIHSHLNLKYESKTLNYSL